MDNGISNMRSGMRNIMTRMRDAIRGFIQRLEAKRRSDDQDVRLGKFLAVSSVIIGTILAL